MLPDIFEENKICVLIPTYNNGGTLAQVINDVLAYTGQIIIINDGSSDGTADILSDFQQLHVINNAVNKGKGYAIRKGIAEAAKLGYAYAITIDSDGQHFAHDLPAFAAHTIQTPTALLIGARNMGHENVPAKSSFGNRFSNFWYWVETGIKLPDTQSGYRLYPLQKLAAMTFYTRKYEFEIEVIVRAAWAGVPVVSIPVSVYYPPPGQRISHFRPFKDFTRISILNTILVLIAFLYIKPRDLTRKLFLGKNIKALLRDVFFSPKETMHHKAASLAFGVFMGVLPVWGFQIILGVALAFLLRLNKGMVFLTMQVSIFPFTPLIWIGSLYTGNLILGAGSVLPDMHHLTLKYLKQQGLSFFLGGTVLAIVAGVMSYMLVYTMLIFLSRNGRIQKRPH